MKSFSLRWSAPEDVLRRSELSQILRGLKSRLYRQAFVDDTAHRFGITPRASKPSLVTEEPCEDAVLRNSL